MKSFKTSRFGDLGYEEGDVLSFPKGIPGFEGHGEWLLAGDDDNPVKWLQSLADADVALPVTTPLTFFPDYHVDIVRSDLSLLRTDSGDGLALLVVVSVPADEPWRATANLRAPIVVNTALRLARQIIVDDESLSLQAPLLPAELRESCRREEEAAGKGPA